MPALRLFAAGFLLALAGDVQAQTTTQAPAPPRPIVREVRVVGASELSDRAVLRAASVEVGQPLPDAPEAIAEAVRKHYSSRGYTFARTEAAFDESSGALTLTVDEGVIDEVEFDGVDRGLAGRFLDEFAL